MTNGVFSISLVDLTIPTASSRPVGVYVPGARFSDMPTSVGLVLLRNGTTASIDGTTKAIGLGWTVSLDPNFTVNAAVDELYANASTWASASGNQFFSVPTPQPSDWSARFANLHDYYPRAINFAEDTPQLYRDLYSLQGYRDTYYIGEFPTALLA